MSSESERQASCGLSVTATSDLTSCVAARKISSEVLQHSWLVPCKRSPFAQVLSKAFTSPFLYHSLLLHNNIPFDITSTMATQTAPSGACATCGKSATTRCVGCTDTENSGAHTVTLYCGKECQIADWQLHKKSCQAIQAKSKLFRASQLLQECFFATRAEAFDLSITSVEVASNGTIHIFEGIPPTRVLQLSLNSAHFVETRNTVLSFRFGRDVFSGLMLDLGRQAFKCVSLVLESDSNADRANLASWQATLRKSRKFMCACSIRASRPTITTPITRRQQCSTMFIMSCVLLSKTTALGLSI